MPKVDRRFCPYLYTYQTLDWNMFNKLLQICHEIFIATLVYFWCDYDVKIWQPTVVLLLLGDAEVFPVFPNCWTCPENLPLNWTGSISGCCSELPSGWVQTPHNPQQCLSPSDFLSVALSFKTISSYYYGWIIIGFQIKCRLRLKQRRNI